MNKEIKIIIIDDSALIRKSLTMMLESDPQIKVVATARDGAEGIEKIRLLRPDVVTLDVEMPGMDGLAALGIIMAEMPLPVLMVSSVTLEGAKATVDALALGAVDFIPKDSSNGFVNISRIKDELLRKVKQISHNYFLLRRLKRLKPMNGPARQNHDDNGKPSSYFGELPRKSFGAVVMGISTGGPFALMQLVPALPADFPLSIAIVQHMPPRFTKSLADRLNSLSNLDVREAQDGDVMIPGLVLIAPGGNHLEFEKNGAEIIARVGPDTQDLLYRPSVDLMMTSAVKAFQVPLIGSIMTGMGNDGLQGLKAIKRDEGYVIAQDERSCVIYGMPKAAVEAGIADIVVPLEEIAEVLSRVAGHSGLTVGKSMQIGR